MVSAAGGGEVGAAAEPQATAKTNNKVRRGKIISQDFNVRIRACIGFLLKIEDTAPVVVGLQELPLQIP